MKISCLPVALFPRFFSGELTMPEWFAIGAASGLDGVDVSTHFFTTHAPARLAPVKKQLAAAALPLVMVTGYPDFTHPDALQRQRELVYLKRDIALSSELGALYFRVLAGQAHPGVGRAEGIRQALENLKKAAETAARFGVTLVYENHSKPSAWFYTDFSHPTDIFLEIAAGLADTGVKINFDTANVLAYGGDTLATLDQVIDRVETIHVADTSTAGILTPVRIGTGLAPLKAVFARLKARGFDGWLCMEDCVGTTADDFADSFRMVRSLWHQA
jgi:sugar phosphate isomerase/epimerase